ncbi:hypothetical protein T07_10147 [Trichinella nelsoni]|uniref:Uncharacterized protein n=1 Tax=Trichinella nelsoni TaxID=6336 RepID=A0A0V0RIU9_9BILA|nr:hypothetical protein T07_10147 [Trichinella nelsoni]
MTAWIRPVDDSLVFSSIVCAFINVNFHKFDHVLIDSINGDDLRRLRRRNIHVNICLKQIASAFRSYANR